MTRKDFVLIARVIRESHDSEGTDVLTSHKISMRKLARSMARELATTNHAFDKGRFLAAATGASDPHMVP